MRVRLLTTAAGPDFGPHDPGTVLDVPEDLALAWFRARSAVPVDVVLPADFFDVPEVEVALDPRPAQAEHAILKRGPGRPRGS